jgi:hypothetical protein
MALRGNRVPSDASAALARVGFWSVWVLLAFAAAGSFLAGRIYLLGRGGRSNGVGLHRSAPLVGLALTALLVTVQFSLPLSLGLLAALTLIRVRTPLKEPEEVGLLMLIMAVAVAAASLKLEMLGAALLAGLVASWVTRRAWPAARPVGHTRVSVAWPRAPAASEGWLQRLEAALAGRPASLKRIGGGPDNLEVEYWLPAMPPDARSDLAAALAGTVAGARIDVSDVPPPDEPAD